MDTKMDTKNKLADALEQLMETKPLDSIFVTEIARKAQVSKQTFYHHFEDKYALMEFCYERMAIPTFEKMNKYYPFSEGCRDLYKLYHNKETFMRNAFSSKDVNGLTEVMFRHVRQTYRHYLAAQGVKDTGDIAFMLDLFTYGATILTKKWIERGMDTPDDELIRLWLKSLPAPLVPYFK
jgi:AcrR family transcriptional regulator